MYKSELQIGYLSYFKKISILEYLYWNVHRNDSNSGNDFVGRIPVCSWKTSTFWTVHFYIYRDLYHVDTLITEVQPFWSFILVYIISQRSDKNARLSLDQYQKHHCDMSTTQISKSSIKTGVG